MKMNYEEFLEEIPDNDEEIDYLEEDPFRQDYPEHYDLEAVS